MCLAQGPQRSDAGEAQARGLVSEYASKDGSGLYLHMCRHAWAFFAQQCSKYQNIICWLKMCTD